MKVGYVRVSTKEQNTARQDEMMERLGVERVYTDKESGSRLLKRVQLAEMMDYVREGDSVVVESISRFARNTLDLLTLVQQLEDKGVAFVSIKEQVDTGTPTGRLFLTMLAGIAQFEREITLQRQAEGIAIAKADGKYRGRQPMKIDMEKFATVYKRWVANEITAVKAMEEMGLKPNKFYRVVAEYEKENGIERDISRNFRGRKAVV